MARRRRTKYTWFPVIGTANTGNIDNVAGRQFALAIGPGSASNVIISELLPDAPQEGDDLANTNPIVVTLGNEYFIRRIVGKLFITHGGIRSANNDPSVPQSAYVAAGIFIARANDSDAGGGINSPIGSATLAERQENYSPFGEDTIREPWIWRRSWILDHSAFPKPVQEAVIEVGSVGVVSTSALFQNFPVTTAGYGSVMDGPHVDAKTARRVRQDERLWFVVAAIPFPVPTTTGASSNIVGYFDFRVLGALRKAKNRGSF